MENNIYDLYQYEEDKKMQSDIIYNIMMNKDMTVLNSMLEKVVHSRFGMQSNRFKTITSRCLSDTSRIAKHGLFFFSLYLDPEFAKSMLFPEPKLNPYKFKIFYEQILPKKCNDLLNGNITSLQRFVEEIRTEYIICPIN